MILAERRSLQNKLQLTALQAFRRFAPPPPPNINVGPKKFTTTSKHAKVVNQKKLSNHNIEIEGGRVTSMEMTSQGAGVWSTSPRERVATRTMHGKHLTSNTELAEFRPSTVTPPPVSSHPKRQRQAYQRKIFVTSVLHI